MKYQHYTSCLNFYILLILKHFWSNPAGFAPNMMPNGWTVSHAFQRVCMQCCVQQLISFLYQLYFAKTLVVTVDYRSKVWTGGDVGWLSCIQMWPSPSKLWCVISLTAFISSNQTLLHSFPVDVKVPQNHIFFWLQSGYRSQLFMWCNPLLSPKGSVV